jgi:hypothetical protein
MKREEIEKMSSITLLAEYAKAEVEYATTKGVHYDKCFALATELLKRLDK